MSASQTQLGKFQMPQVGDTLEGRYQIRKVLASGGMGVILQAKHLRMGREVAVKVLHPHIAQEAAVLARFEREVRLAQTLNHPNTIRLYDFGEAENGLVYVVMELLEGADLKEIIAAEGPMPMGRVVGLSLQLLDGLAEAHEQDFVHRDLKPSNLFVTKNRRGEDLIKILDFGIAKSLEETGADLTATGSICGTAAYVAPEYLHSGEPQKQADVYAVGLIILEMLTGKRAFHGSTTAQTLLMQMQRHVCIPPAVAATPLGAIIERAVQKDPTKRFGDAEQMFAALEAVADDLPDDLRLARHQIGELLAPPSGTSQPPPRFARPAGPESSTSLPQPQGTPLTGAHPVAAQSVAEDDATLVTPLPSPVDHSHPFEARPEARPGPTTAEVGGSARTSKKWIGLAVAVGVVCAAALAAGLKLGSSETSSDSSASEQASVPVAAKRRHDESTAKAEDKAAPDRGGAVAAVADESETKSAAEPLEFPIESEPEGATVYVGGKRLGQTPLVHRVEAEALPHTLELEMDGFEPARLELSGDSEGLQRAVLVEVEKPEPAPAAKPPPRRQRPAKRAESAKEDPAPKKPAKDENVDEFLDEYL